MAKNKNSNPGTLPLLSPGNKIKQPSNVKVNASWGKPPKGGLISGAIKAADPTNGLNKDLAGSYKDASTPAQAATPGTTVDPFLTGDQQIAQSQFFGSIAEQAAAARARLLDQQRSSAQGTQDVKDNQVKQTGQANWASAARGIFQSSIRNNTLNDIDATTALQVNRFQDAIDSIKQQNTTDFGYTFDGDNGAADVMNAGMSKDAQGNWVPNIATRVGQQIASRQTGENQNAKDNAQALNSPGTPAAAASGPSKQWFVDQLTSPQTKADRQKLRDLAVKSGYAKYKDGKAGAIAWV